MGCLRAKLANSTGCGLYNCTVVLIFEVCTAVLIFGQCRHKISTASVSGTVVVCTIGTAVLIFGLNRHKISTPEGLISNYAVLSRI